MTSAQQYSPSVTQLGQEQKCGTVQMQIAGSPLLVLTTSKSIIAISKAVWDFHIQDAITILCAKK